MSRSISQALHGLIRAATAPQSARRRAMTIARLMERLDTDSATTIRTRQGLLKVLPHRGPHLAAAAIGFDAEEPETLGWIDAIRPGETLWDIGAATGLLSMYAALIPDIQVFAFEPKATSFGVLVEHLALNDLGDRVFALCVAFSDETVLTHLALSAMAPGSGFNSISGRPDQFGGRLNVFNQSAVAYRIDDFRTAFNLKAPDHIKIDVDGIEGAILRGAPETLRQVKSVLLEVEGENAAEATSRIDAPLNVAGLVEDIQLRTSGSKRNRLYRRS